MQPAPQPLIRAQQPLAAYWQAFLGAPQLRVGRWLTTEANRPLLHDYLVRLSEEPEAPLRRLPATDGDWMAPAGLAEASVTWLETVGAGAEDQLRKHLTGRNPQRLLVLEDLTTQPLQRLARWFPASVQTCTPAVSMQQLLTELSQTATTDQPADLFQRQFHQLTQAIAQADSGAVTAHAAACLATAATLPGVGATVTVGLASGHYFLSQKQPDEALRHFAAALVSAEKAFELGDASAGLLSVQVWLGEAAAWQQRRRRPAARAALQLAVDRANLLPASLLGVEAARQLGLSFDQDGQGRPALAAYLQGLRIAEQLPAGQRPATAIQALGDAYARCLRTPPERQALRLRLAALVD